MTSFRFQNLEYLIYIQEFIDNIVSCGDNMVKLTF